MILKPRLRALPPPPGALALPVLLLGSVAGAVGVEGGAYGQPAWPGVNEPQWGAAPGFLAQPWGLPQGGAALLQGPAAPQPKPAQKAAQECECPQQQDTGACKISRLMVHQEHLSNSGLSLADVTALYGGMSALTPPQRQRVVMAPVASTSLMCLDDRVVKPALATPGGDLGEFILGLASYLQERDPSSANLPTQEAVNTYLVQYLDSIPAERPMVHCTDDRAIQHLEETMPIENLDLRNPPGQVDRKVLMQKLMQAENHGDSHIRLMLKQPEWFQLNAQLVPMVLRAYYGLLWQQHPKVALAVLSGESNPQAFFEVSSGETCQSRGVAPMLTPRENGRSVLISHLDAVSLRRLDLASFFARIAVATPRKVDKEQLHQRMDRHGWLALETTGSRIGAGLPFFTLSYT